MDEPDFAIRPARALDAPALTRVARAAKASWGYPRAWMEAWKPLLAFSEDYLLGNVVFVAERGGKVVGVAALEETDGGAELGHLWVLPEAQGRGVGRALMSRVVEEARSRGHRDLRIESDPQAEPFYRGLGAVPVGDVSRPVDGVARRLPVLRLALRSSE